MAVTVTPRSAVYTNISATTTAVPLVGGLYGLTVAATWGGGSVKLDKLAADGSTYVTISTYTANIFETQYLPDGTYRFTVATASAIYIDMRAVVAVKDGGGEV